MKTLSTKLILITTALWALLWSAGVLAQTDADITISNSATLSFNTGGSGLSIISTPTGNTDVVGGGGTDAAGISTDFEVDRLINFTIANLGADWNDGANVAIGQDDVIIGFTITNNSNSPLDFDLVAVVDDGDINDTPATFSTGVDYVAATTAWASGITPTIFVDNNDAGGYEPGTDTLDFVDELAAGGVRNIYVLLDIPATAIQNQTAPVSIVAQAAGTTVALTGAYTITGGMLGTLIVADSNGNDSPGNATATSVVDDATVVQNVFAEALGLAGEEGASDSTDFTATNFDASGTLTFAANDGQQGASSGVWIDGAQLRLTKEVLTIWDPINHSINPKAIPGAYVRYTITIENIGGSVANITSLTPTDPDLTDIIDDSVHNFDLGFLETGCGSTDNTTCDDGGISPATYNAATDPGVGVLVQWDDGSDGVDSSLEIDSGTAFTSSTTLALDLTETILDMTVTGETDGDLGAGDSVIIQFNTIIE